ncbi:glycosyltransferase family 4 protein [Inhella sp.]|uniref:glycosyltransferase family 4 protein n=1 Tax=Inhella sp. TaxID=1921806 RepID=UPI0035B42DCB
MRLAILANSAWYLQNFRLGLARHLRELGHEVVFIAPADGYETRLTDAGFAFHPWELAAGGTRPLQELASLWQLRGLLRRLQVQALLSFTPKGNLYGGLALPRGARFLPNVSGLGRLFIEPGALTQLVKPLYRPALGRAACVLFQNEDDRAVFVQLGLVAAERTRRLPGSGVDLQRFQPAPRHGPARRFLMVARLLRDKGVHEFVAAARVLKQERPDCDFVLLGSSRAANPTAVSAAELQAWLQAGWVQHIEQVDDVRPELACADCVVLPSYREGVPRSLLEAAAMAKPLLATDVPGCRDVVRPGLNGWLCAPRNSAALTQALRDVLACPPERLQDLGQAGRTLVEREFDEQRVFAAYAELLR